MTLSELCKAYRVARPAVKAWIAAGLPHEKRGRGYDFDQKAVDAWLLEKGIRARTRDALAQHLGVALRTVAGWISRGMPTLEGGGYDLEAVDAWLETSRSRGGAPPDTKGRQQRERLRDLEIELAETKLAQQRGRLIEVEPVRRMLVRHIHEAKAILDQLPDRVLGVLPSRTKAGVRRSVRKRVAAAVDGAYTMLADSLDDLEKQVKEVES